MSSNNTVFIDVDSQIDFLYPAGALYVPGAELIVPAIATLNRHAASHSIPLISTADDHLENDPEFAHWPAHCVRGTLGQRKPAETIVAGHRLVTKRNVNAFAEPALEKELAALAPARCVVYGVATDICVFHIANGLAQRGYSVEIVADAVRGIDESKIEQMRQTFRFRTIAEATANA